MNKMKRQINRIGADIPQKKGHKCRKKYVTFVMSKATVVQVIIISNWEFWAFSSIKSSGHITYCWKYCTTNKNQPDNAINLYLCQIPIVSKGYWYETGLLLSSWVFYFFQTIRVIGFLKNFLPHKIAILRHLKKNSMTNYYSSFCKGKNKWSKTVKNT